MAVRPTFHDRPRVTRILLIAGVLLSLTLGLAYLMLPALLGAINLRTMDMVMALAGARPTSGAIVIVDIDDNSLSRYGQWPWPRWRLAQLLDAVNAAGAASMGVDLILAEPDRTSAGTTLARRQPADRSGEQGGPPDHDLELTHTLAQGPFVLGYEFLFGNSAKMEPACRLHPPSLTWMNIPAAEGVQAGFFAAQGAVCNRRMFSEAVTNSGFLNAAPDADGILRRIPMLIGFDRQLYPSLALAMLMQFAHSSQIEIHPRETGWFTLRAGNRSIAIDPQGTMTVRFSRPVEPQPRLSAAAVLQGEIGVDQLKDKIVLVGLAAAGLGPGYQTAAGPVPTPADIHAQVLDNILTNQQVIRTLDLPCWEVLIGLLMVLAVSLSVARLNILASAAVSIALLAGCWIGMVSLFQLSGCLLSPFLPTGLVTLNFGLLTILKTWQVELAARERAESALTLLRSSQSHLHSIIKTIPDIIFRLDPTGRITFISPAIAKYSPPTNNLIGHPIFDLVLPEDLPRVRYRLLERRTGERATSGFELRLLLPCSSEGGAEEVRHFSVSAEGIYQGEGPDSGRFVGTQGILRDITEQKRLEEKLLSAQKLEAIGSLAAGVAHDLNNILAGLVTYPDLLLLELPLDSPLRDKISLIQRSGKSAAAIVQDLLTLGRRGMKTTEIVNLNSVITEYLASLEFATSWQHHPHIDLVKNLAPDLLKIRGSRAHLAKAIMNLLINAAEAMPANGSITISSYNRFIDSPLTLYEEIPLGAYACVCVADEGVGMVGEDFQKIFEPFYSKKKMKRSGSGLGMTVIWATIKDHGGYIDLQSREGEGTSITLYFPATREQEEASPLKAVLEDYIGTERVLVVDDMAEQLHIATSMLAKLGYAVTAAASGEAAVEYLQSHRADLVVLDMIMPGGMDGLETYKRMLALCPGQRAIITSGFSESERVQALHHLGAGAYIPKPYTLERLGQAVRRELDR